jgi:hypothetical protein
MGSVTYREKEEVAQKSVSVNVWSHVKDDMIYLVEHTSSNMTAGLCAR